MVDGANTPKPSENMRLMRYVPRSIGASATCGSLQTCGYGTLPLRYAGSPPPPGSKIVPVASTDAPDDEPW